MDHLHEGSGDVWRRQLSAAVQQHEAGRGADGAGQEGRDVRPVLQRMVSHCSRPLTRAFIIRNRSIFVALELIEQPGDPQMLCVTHLWVCRLHWILPGPVTRASCPQIFRPPDIVFLSL